MSSKGKLLLIPNTLGETDPRSSLPQHVFLMVQDLAHFIVEHPKNARRHLIGLGLKEKLNDLAFYPLNKHTRPEELSEMLQVLQKGHDVGLLSDAGCPGIADPGSEIIRIAHEQKIEVIPLTGPSSIFLALMASGLNGQQFAFHGYLPHDKGKRKQFLRSLEKEAKQGYTQIFMETPFRNEQLMKTLISTLSPDTFLCIGTDITLSSASIKTKTIREWSNKIPQLHKRPSVFLLGR